MIENVTLATIIVFLISLVISAIIIYFVTKIFGETEGFGTALLAAFIGAIIYAAAYYYFIHFLRPELGWVASLIGGIAWLIALGILYSIGWLKALGIAIIVWIIAAIVSFFLPTVIGPL